MSGKQLTIFDKPKTSNGIVSKNRGKTCIEWLNKLPKPIREKALKNLENHPFANPDFKTKSLRFAIRNSFYCPETPEGLNYWDSVADEYGCKKRIFKPGICWPKIGEKLIKVLCYNGKVLTLTVNNNIGVAWNNSAEIPKEYFDKEVQVWDYIDYKRDQ